MTAPTPAERLRRMEEAATAGRWTVALQHNIRGPHGVFYCAAIEKGAGDVLRAGHEALNRHERRKAAALARRKTGGGS